MIFFFFFVSVKRTETKTERNLDRGSVLNPEGLCKLETRFALRSRIENFFSPLGHRTHTYEKPRPHDTGRTESKYSFEFHGKSTEL